MGALAALRCAASVGLGEAVMPLVGRDNAIRMGVPASDVNIMVIERRSVACAALRCWIENGVRFTS